MGISDKLNDSYTIETEELPVEIRKYRVKAENIARQLTL